MLSDLLNTRTERTRWSTSFTLPQVIGAARPRCFSAYVTNAPLYGK